MKKKEYIAPLTEISLMAVEAHLMKTSNEEWTDPGNSDAKEQGGLFDFDDDFGDTWDDQDNTKDLWGED